MNNQENYLKEGNQGYQFFNVKIYYKVYVIKIKQYINRQIIGVEENIQKQICLFIYLYMDDILIYENVGILSQEEKIFYF